MGADDNDLQEAAKANLTSKAWAYMSSGATDQYSESMQGCTIPQS